MREDALIKLGIMDGLTGLYYRKFLQQIETIMQDDNDICTVSLAMIILTALN